MFNGYLYQSYNYPFYRSPYSFPVFNNGGSGFPGYNYFSSSNIIGSAIANQNMNVIGSGAIGGTQIATPTVVW